MDSRFVIARSVAEALAALQNMGPDAVPIAGGTWLMREPLRHSTRPRPLVGLGGISELREIRETAAELSIGAGVTHDELVRAFAGRPGLAGLVGAAGHSANPGIRRLATVGGNLCTCDFAAADLQTALLALNATVEVHSQAGIAQMPLERFLQARRNLIPGQLLTRVIVSPANCVSSHARLPLRKAGDYPVAIVSMVADRHEAGILSGLRVAVGSIEHAASRWTAIEEAASGRALDAEDLRDLARLRLTDFQPRRGLDVPDWYRLEVLPSLVARAYSDLAAE